MKAKLFVSAKLAEVRLPETNKAIVKKAKEDLEDFKARAISEIASDNLIEESEVQLQVVDAKAVKKFPVDQVVTQYIKETANQKSAKFALLKESLEEREVQLPEITPEMIAEAKAAAKPKKEPKAPKEPGEKKELKKRMTLEEAEALKEEWKNRKGEEFTFRPRGVEEDVTATMNGVVIDKRANMVLIRLKDADGQIYHKTPGELTDPAEKPVKKAAAIALTKTAPPKESIEPKGK